MKEKQKKKSKERQNKCIKRQPPAFYRNWCVGVHLYFTSTKAIHSKSYCYASAQESTRAQTHILNTSLEYI